MLIIRFFFEQKKKRETGFEPATPTLARLYSTPEPLAHVSYDSEVIVLQSNRFCQQVFYFLSGTVLITFTCSLL